MIAHTPLLQFALNFFLNKFYLFVKVVIISKFPTGRRSFMQAP